MKNDTIRQEVIRIFQRAEERNRAERYKSLHTFMTYKGGKMFDFGIYNYKTKKYVLCFAHSLTIEKDLAELQAFIQK